MNWKTTRDAVGEPLADAGNEPSAPRFRSSATPQEPVLHSALAAQEGGAQVLRARAGGASAA